MKNVERSWNLGLARADMGVKRDVPLAAEIDAPTYRAAYAYAVLLRQEARSGRGA